MTANWQKEYEQWLFAQATEESHQDTPSLSDEQFEKYIEYIAMITSVEDTDCELLATNQIYDNYHQSAQVVSEEMQDAKISFYATARKQ